MLLPAKPIRIAIVNDYAIVVTGLAKLLAPHRDRVVVVEVDSRRTVVSDVDLVLVDTFGRVSDAGLDLNDLVGADTAKVVVFTWSAHPQAIAAALAQGASGCVSKSLCALPLVEALEAVHRGETVISADLECGNASGLGDWPGRGIGLTAREAEMVSFIAQGLTNHEIAAAAYLSINSVKTYIRLAYRKMGVTRRSQAVLWAIEHGFVPDTTRAVAI